MKFFHKLLRIIGFVAFLCFSLEGHCSCSGAFMNPLTDICWSCIFPIEVMGKVLADENQFQAQKLSDIKPAQSCDPAGVTCRCDTRCGVPLGFNEPARQYDVTRSPGCFPGLGIEVDMSDLPSGNHGSSSLLSDIPKKKSFAHVNVYVNPVLYWLNIVPDNPCLEMKGFDILYFTPADVCWDNEDLCNFLTPESFLFGSMAAELACTADCIAQTAAQYEAVNDPSRELIRSTYWCAGCNGRSLPLTGIRENTIGDIQDSMTLGQRMFQKLHRVGAVWGTSGAMGMCSYYPKPLMDKLDYKVSMVFPMPQTKKLWGKCCQLFGASTVPWEQGSSWPITGEDYSYMVFRRRDCCIGQTSVEKVMGN